MVLRFDRVGQIALRRNKGQFMAQRPWRKAMLKQMGSRLVHNNRMSGMRATSRLAKYAVPAGRFLGAAGRLAARASPWVGGAMAAYDIGKAGYNYFKGRSSKKQMKAASGSGKVYSGGNVSRVGKFKRSTGRSFDIYNKYGVCAVREMTGTVDDPDAVYLMTESVSPRSFVTALSQAILRKLLDKAGYNVTSFKTAINSVDYGAHNLGAAAPVLQYQITEVNVTTNAIAVSTTTFNSGDSIVAAAVGIEASLLSFMNGYTAGASQNYIEPRQILLRSKPGSLADTVDEWTIRAVISYDEITVHYKSANMVKFQNRSVSAGGGTNAEDINNNPLQGYMYYFKGIPRAKSNRFEAGSTAGGPWKLFEYVPGFDSVKSFGASAAPQYSKEPPSPSAFYNCKSASRVVISPGSIKTAHLSAKGSKSLFPLLKQIRYQPGDIAVPITKAQYNYSIFPTLVLGLEDVINVNPAENIAVAFEVERRLGVFISTKKKKWCDTLWETNVITEDT